MSPLRQGILDHKEYAHSSSLFCFVLFEYLSIFPYPSQVPQCQWNYFKLEQRERLRSNDTPAASWIPILLSHIGSQVKRRQSQSYKFKEFAKIANVTILKQSLLGTHLLKLFIRCANMKWIRRVLLNMQSGHTSVHRRTDGQGETSIPPFQLRWSGGYKNTLIHTQMIHLWWNIP